VAIIMGQWAIAGTAPVTLAQVPPGRCSVTFYSTTATGQLYLGTGTGLTASNGYGVTTYPTAFQAYGSSKGTQIYGLNTAATTLPVNYIISTEG
jgi:hypothetical protein